MRVAVTGTPGTGKTTVSDLVETDLDVVHLNDVVREEGFHEGEDPDRGSLYADLDRVAEWLGDRACLVESHLAHHLDADRVVVLRCHPDEVEARLRERGESEEKARENEASTKSPQALARYARENAEAEALDVILSEAVARHGLDHVYEIDTTDRTPDAVARDVEAVLRGDRDPSAGTVDFTDYL
ncbi:adenylate kinase family protein [Halomarina litorea]|uniref:adenylate kinase family protein n=1 Tax=Halomarina litorea TaxID=2961595 RepID=UPI0020C5B34E|nr:adenylate kinase family protein [Halomarina sp. BCD28]